MEEDGFSLLREWLFPRVEGGLQAVQAPDADERSLEHALFQVLQGAVAAGARDLDIRTFWDPVGAGFAVAQFAHAADGPDFTQLKQLLEKGIWETDSTDWTRMEISLPVGPPDGCILTLWRTHAAGATLEAWLLSDGSAEIHVLSEPSPGQRIQWFLRGFTPETLEGRLARVLQSRPARPELRVFVNGREHSWPSTPAGALSACRLSRPWGECVLYRLDHPDGEIRLFHKGFWVQSQPCPVAFHHFDWDSRFRMDAGNAASAVARDFQDAMKLERKAQDEKSMPADEKPACVAHMLEAAGPFSELERIGASLLRFLPGNGGRLHLVFLDPAPMECWPMFVLASDDREMPPSAGVFELKLPGFPATALPVARRVACRRFPKPDVCGEWALALDHPFVHHLFSIVSPPEAMYFLVRLIALELGIDFNGNEWKKAIDSMKFQI